MEKKYVLFDLDGTLVDSYEGVTNAYRYACEKMGVPVRPDDLTEVIGPPVHDTFQKYYDFDVDRAFEGVRYFREYYCEKGIYELKPYEGVTEMLETLYAHGKKLMMATCKPQFMAESIAVRLGFAPYLCFISGVNAEGKEESPDEPLRLNKSDVIRHALVSNDIKDIENAVMVGDRASDVRAAAGFGMQTVGALYGYAREGELKNADYLAACTADITAYII